MNFKDIIDQFTPLEGVAVSTMMGTPCLRYRGDFFTMYFEKEESLIVKLPALRVTKLIEEGLANEFNFTKKRFKEWALIPVENQDRYQEFVIEALEYVVDKA